MIASKPQTGLHFSSLSNLSPPRQAHKESGSTSSGDRKTSKIKGNAAACHVPIRRGSPMRAIHPPRSITTKYAVPNDASSKDNKEDDEVIQSISAGQLIGLFESKTRQNEASSRPQHPPGTALLCASMIADGKASPSDPIIMELPNSLSGWRLPIHASVRKPATSPVELGSTSLPLPRHQISTSSYSSTSSDKTLRVTPLSLDNSIQKVANNSSSIQYQVPVPFRGAVTPPLSKRSNCDSSRYTVEHPRLMSRERSVPLTCVSKSEPVIGDEIVPRPPTERSVGIRSASPNRFNLRPTASRSPETSITNPYSRHRDNLEPSNKEAVNLSSELVLANKQLPESASPPNSAVSVDRMQSSGSNDSSGYHSITHRNSLYPQSPPIDPYMLVSSHQPFTDRPHPPTTPFTDHLHSPTTPSKAAHRSPSARHQTNGSSPPRQVRCRRRSASTDKKISMETLLERKDAELVNMRETMERNELAMTTAYRERIETLQEQLKLERHRSSKLEAAAHEARRGAQRSEMSLSEATSRLDQLTNLPGHLSDCKRQVTVLADRCSQLERALGETGGALDTATQELFRYKGSGSRHNILPALVNRETQTSPFGDVSPSVAESRYLVALLRKEIEQQASLFSSERQNWLVEKSKVIAYQKQLQSTHNDLLQRTQRLESQLAQMTQELRYKEQLLTKTDSVTNNSHIPRPPRIKASIETEGFRC